MATFTAKLIGLAANGPTYSNPKICLDPDPESPLGEDTISFVADGKSVLTTRGLVGLIHLHANGFQRRKHGFYNRIVLNGSLVYTQINILSPSRYEQHGVPDVFGEHQLVFTCQQGLFITKKGQVVSLIS